MLFDNLALSGGGQRLLLSLARELMSQGHQITIFAAAFNPDACYPELCRNMDIRALKTMTGREGNRSETWISRAGQKLNEYFVEPRKLANLVTENYDIINPHERPMHRTAVLLKQKLNAPIVWMFNDPGSWEINYHDNARMPRPARAIKAFLMRRADRKLVRQIDAVAVLSHGVQAIFHREFGVYPYVVRCGIDHDLAIPGNANKQVRERLGIDDETVLILFLAVLSPSRRVQDLIRAFARVHASGRKVSLAVVGSSRYAPEYLSKLQEEAKRQRISGQVIFVPESISDSERKAFFQACDIFVWPNEAQSWGLAPLEAMICGKPVIVSIGAGVHEVLRDGENALLVPPRRPDLLAKALMVLADDPAFRRRVGEAGAVFARKELSWGRMSLEMNRLFEQVLDRSSIAPAHLQDEPVKDAAETWRQPVVG